MVFWILAIALTAITCAALYYAAASGGVNESTGEDSSSVTAHFQAQLAEIDMDLAAGRLNDTEAEAARAELARELVRQKAETARRAAPVRPISNLVLAATLPVLAITALGTYWFLGSPDRPAMPLAARQVSEAEPSGIDIDRAIAEVEARLESAPTDLRGWQVLAPIYMQRGRFDDAAAAYRRILELQQPSADTETDLAEALMMANGGAAEGEPIALLQSAAARDPLHVRSRFYLAGEATRVGDFARARELWSELLSLSNGDEAWVATARRGLDIAEAGLAGEPLPLASTPAPTPEIDAAQQEMIRGMVEGLATRLDAEGGTLEEWTRLVRSRLVLGETEAAQAAYDAARTAYPDAADRAALDAMAAQAGLE